MSQDSPADLVIQKLRRLIAEKVAEAGPGSLRRQVAEKMLGLSDDDLLDTIGNALRPNPHRVGCPPQETRRELAMRTRPVIDPWWEHVLTCSPCATEIRELGRRHRPGTSTRH
ncbi:MAG TPA: hypothetical protein VK689_09125 [Armatimonadota bacterium]|jgi:hypothetical protein|nr:hypothetical protein [Armatimonadota bacterium]